MDKTKCTCGGWHYIIEELSPALTKEQAERGCQRGGELYAVPYDNPSDTANERMPSNWKTRWIVYRKVVVANSQMIQSARSSVASFGIQPLPSNEGR